MKRLFIFIMLAIALFSCNNMKQKTKETLNKGGETIGETATEFFEGVSKGVDKTLECDIAVSPALQEKGLRTGKFSITNHPDGGENNLLVLYLIFEKDFKTTLLAKAYDKNGLETGRSKTNVEGKAGEAGYYDFLFDKRTYIEARSKISIE